MAKFIITGGAGFIGSNIAHKLVSLKNEVIIIDNLLTGTRQNLEEVWDKIKFIEGDIRNLSLLCEIFDGIDYVIHTAALPSVQRSIEDPVLANEINITGSLNVAIAAYKRKVKKVIYSSSSSVYGNSLVLPKKENMLINPLSPYGVNKYAAEAYFQVFSETYNLPTVSLRYFNVFGPKQNIKSEYAAVIPKFIKAMLNNESPVIFGDGEQTRDFTYIDNVVNANLLAIKSNIGTEILNIACGEQISLNNLVKLLNEVLGTKILPKYADARKGDIKHSLADITKAKELINYSVKINFKEGLKKTIEWFKNYV